MQFVYGVRVCINDAMLPGNEAYQHSKFQVAQFMDSVEECWVCHEATDRAEAVNRPYLFRPKIDTRE
jgi:hypothetical protein